jgi:hypothetical protein
MRTRIALAFAATLAVALAAPAPTSLESSAHLRAGFDTNPLAAGGPATAALGGDETFVTAAGMSFGFATPERAHATSLKLAYAGETVRYENCPAENHTTHRLSAAPRAVLAGWQITADGSTLYVDGDRDTLPSIAACNGNGTSLWRERRAQWQHRAKFLAQRDAGTLRIRFVGTLLDYDYLTRARAGRAAFADRADRNGGADLGWKQSARSLWFAGARFGAQDQDTLPLPGGSVECSNRYTRLLAGWEGALGAKTTVALAAGPDFRHYNGAVDPRTFRQRRHTFGWFDASLTTKLSPSLTLTAKTMRWAWLSSTGKSAYTDFGAEVSIAWAVDKNLALRATAKAHQCSYFPTVRNDWEYLGGLGLTYKPSPRWQLTADVLDHHGWNELSGFEDRNFERLFISLGASVKL